MRMGLTVLGLLAIVAIGWLVLAGLSGTFIPDDARFAVTPGTFTPDAWASKKKLIDLGGYRVAYIDIGKGDPVILLHGCPFSIYEWHEVAPLLARHFRVIAPDLLGLGDTPVRLNDDYRLPRDVKMVTDLMDRLGIRSARFVGHDHGGAIVQLLMQHDPGRIDMAILTNVEAYDQWPSKPETVDLYLITNPITSPLAYFAVHSRWVQRDLYSIAVANQATLTDDTLSAFATEHLATPLRWQRLRRFLRWQLDPTNNRLTETAVPAMRRFEKPVLLLWGQNDTNFGPEIAIRLARDIPGTLGLEWLTHSAHLPMLEEPTAYADAADKFFRSGVVDHDAVVSLVNARRQGGAPLR
jgi:2-hydroxymuconate-semialdehyde hydrolase